MKTYEETLEHIWLTFFNYRYERASAILEKKKGNLKLAESDNRNADFWKTHSNSEISLISFVFNVTREQIIRDLQTLSYEKTHCDMDREMEMFYEFPHFVSEFREILFPCKTRGGSS